MRDAKLEQRGESIGLSYQADVYYLKTMTIHADEQENLEETLVDSATAARTIQELEAEIEILKGLEIQARCWLPQVLIVSGKKLSKILQNDPAMLGS